MEQTVTEAEYKRLKRIADRAAKDHAKAEGQLEAAMGRLKEEFGCTTLKGAAALQKKLDADADKATVAYTKAKDAFEAEYAEDLD